MKLIYRLSWLALAVVFLYGGLWTAKMQSTTTTEGFEAGGKTAYAVANVTLGSGSWNLDEALTGNTASDHKTGSYAARVRNTGVVSMNFNRANAGVVSVKHAVYGADSASNWELWSSANSGGAWTKVGATVATSSTTLQTASFTVNTASAIRFQIRKTSGGANRVNLDDISITAYSAPTPTPTPTPPPSSSEHLTLGNPSGAATAVNQPFNYLMEKPQYALSYHRDNGGPKWVSWHLDNTWLGSAPRQNDFRADTTLPSGWYQVQGTDFSGSGFDRGHMCPSADRTNTVASNSATFLMTNMIPQLPANNQGPWADMENYLRTLVTAGNELYIISGGYGLQFYIANGHVAVPNQTWKVVVVLPNGTNDASRVTASTRTIAVLMPNSGAINSNWRNYRVSIDQIEGLTGYDFFSAIPKTTQEILERRRDRL